MALFNIEWVDFRYNPSFSLPGNPSHAATVWNSSHIPQVDGQKFIILLDAGFDNIY
jgi:hypothetical protein